MVVTFGFGDAFWLSPTRQSDTRIRFDELWVPAAAIIETNLKDPDAQQVQKEARARLRKGKGIKVFSSPKALEGWLKKENLTLAAREDCIVRAGDPVPGFKKSDAGHAEFFVHCPLSWKQNENDEIERNEDSIVLHVTIEELQRDTCIILGSDVNSDTLSEIVKATKRHKNERRLEWDVLKLFHHCSYKALNKDGKEDDPTKPVPDVAWLMEDQGQDRSIIVSSNQKIPSKGSTEDNDQPPHRKAAGYYKSLQNDRNGQFLVTMDDPKKPIKIEITPSGAKYLLAAPALAGSSAAAKPMRAG